MTEVPANNLNDYIGKHFIHTGNILGQEYYCEGTLISVETYASDFGFGDHIVTYADLDGNVADFFVFGRAIFQILN